MKVENSKKNIISLAVVSTLTLNTIATPVLAMEKEESKEVNEQKENLGNESYVKNENIYAKLKGDGSVKEVQIVNAFDLKEETTIKDYGTYKNVVNLTNLDKITCSEDEVEFKAEEGKFYYQGTYSSELPWKVNIKYYLDGKEISPENLGGASGDLKIQIKTTKNSKVNESFYENYLMQISLTLDSNKVTELVAKGGTLAEAGENQSITFAVMPETDGDYTIEAKVKDFSMKGITMAAVPFSMNIDTDTLKVDEITSEMDKMTDAVKQLNEGAKQLNKGMEELTKGGTSLKDGVSQLGEGLEKLDSNGQILVGASEQIKDALNKVSTELSAGNMEGLKDLNSIPVVLQQLADGLSQIKAGTVELHSNFTKAYAALDGTINAASQNTLTSEEIAALQSAMANSAVDPVALSMYQKLMKAYEDVQKIQGVYEAVKPVFEALNHSLNPNPQQGMENTSLVVGVEAVIGGLNQMSEELTLALNDNDIAGDLMKLQQGLGTLASSYGDFHGGLVEYTKGVTAVKQGSDELSQGVNLYTDGVKEAGEGTNELATGTEEFEKGTSDMPKAMEDTIDEMLKKYSGENFKPVSFVDERNTNIGSVQFIMVTEEIKTPVVETEVKAEPKLGFWERLLKLFEK